MTSGNARSIWSGFYKKPIKERKTQLKLVYPDLFKAGDPLHLDENIANNMIENCIGTLEVPLGLGLNFTINGKQCVAPMAVEEPSVIAAVSGVAKLVSETSLDHGFVASTSGNIVYSQVQITDVDKIYEKMDLLHQQRDKLVAQANQFCASMKARGGGVVEMSVRAIKKSAKKGDWLVVHFHIDVCDSMGANIATEVAEKMAPHLQAMVGGRVGLKILSNLSLERTAKAQFRIPTNKLAYKGIDGSLLAEQIVEAYEYACDDPFRAVTHNKGIMNGIDALALATGQDWRAIEASSHAWASLRDPERGYQPLTRYWIEDDVLVGELEIPISVGTQGGAIKTHPAYRFALGLAKIQSSQELAQLMACVGLAQNFAALRALSSEGIQRGHMSLHARNIAMAAGAPPFAIEECVLFMIETGNINQASAKRYLEAHKLQTMMRTISQTFHAFPSMFYCEIATRNGPLSLNVAFQTIGDSPVVINFSTEQHDPLMEQLFGEKAYSWISSVLHLLDRVEIVPTDSPRLLERQSQKLKCTSILMNIISRSLLIKHEDTILDFFRAIVDLPQLGPQDLPIAQEWLEKEDQHTRIALPLLFSLWQVFEYQVGQWIGIELLSKRILQAQRDIMLSLIGSTDQNIDSYMNLHGSRYQVPLFMLCDAICFNESLITPQALEYIADLGAAFELQQIVAHDVSPTKLHRDIELMRLKGLSKDAAITHGVVNGFLFWLSEHKHFSDQQILDLLDGSDVAYKSHKQLYLDFIALFSKEISGEFAGIDLDKCRHATKLYRQYYQVEWLY
ncbi:hydroxymethylglutaryl-CoA reductase [Gorgonomyces haynaldii]|nr:hydroxymethylglutaryl-CoA reductase [Gorgonomyces haynaldii]